MTDSRKLTDNELEQVAGGIGGFTPGLPGESFSVGNYVERSMAAPESVSAIVYRIDTLDGNNATATMYEKDLNGAVTTTTGQSIILGMNWIKLDPKPGWVPAN